VLIGCAGLAVLAIAREPRSFAHRVFAVGVLHLAVTELLTAMAADASSLAGALWWKRFAFVAEAFLPGIWILFSMSFARGRIARSRWSLGAAFAIPVTLASAGSGALLFISPDGPTGAHLALGGVGKAYFITILLLAVVVLVNLEATLRASTGAKRWRIKFLLLGIGGYFATHVYLGSQAILFSAVDLSLEAARIYVAVVSTCLMALGLYRARELPSEVYLSHSAVYRSVTVFLVGAYLVVVGVLGDLLDRFAGRHVLPLGVLFLFLAVLGLAVLVLSEELRQNLKRFLIRNFRRPRYDYRKQWATFTERTASQLDAGTLSSIVAGIASETFGVGDVTLWLTSEGDVAHLGGSTSIVEEDLRDSPHLLAGASRLARRMSDVEGVLEVDPRSVDLDEEDRRFMHDGRVRHAIA
ncbi:MAG: histidine kinase N-terminal 7TM domain-containing protein, partial [Candidatus Binatia bacterium]